MARKNRLRRRGKSHTGRNIVIILVLLVLTGLGIGGWILFEPEKPLISLAHPPEYLGRSVQMNLQATDGRSGLRSVVVELEQNGKSHRIFSRDWPRRAWFSRAGQARFQEKITLDVTTTGVKDGKATLILSARDFSLNGLFKGNLTEVRLPVTIDTRPPRVAIEHGQRYIRPGGSGIVIYSLSEDAVRHGVRIDEMFFPGYPLDDKRFISYIALPWNSDAPKLTRVEARDQAGNTGKAVFDLTVKKVRLKKDRITISDSFLRRKLPEFREHYPDLSGSPIEQYITVNNQIRRENAEKIRAICGHPEEKQLWHDRFLRMPGAGRAGFADQRTYYYQGKAIDHQTHLGMDIASTARAVIRAANSGKVIFTDYLGIYGNTVIIDHGQGLFSLYAHLSRIDTKEGALVAKGDPIARSGLTGMAGGDHLHFSILVHGIFVTPVEWWDQHWIDVNINNVLAD